MRLSSWAAFRSDSEQECLEEKKVVGRRLEGRRMPGGMCLCGWMGREIPGGRVHVGDGKGRGMPGGRLRVGDGRKGECQEDGCMWKMGKEGYNA